MNWVFFFMFINVQCTLSFILRQSLLSQVLCRLCHSTYEVIAARIVHAQVKGQLVEADASQGHCRQSRSTMKSYEAKEDTLAATSGSLAPSGNQSPIVEGCRRIKRDPLSKRKRTKLILSRMTVVEDDYDYKGQGNVTDIDFHILKVFLNPF